MKARTMMWLTALAVIAVLALPARAAAQQNRPAPYPYVLIDLGTLGGPQSFLDLPAVPLTERGIALGQADTTISDTDYPNFNPFMGQDPHIIHAFEWQKGVLTDLGALPGNNSSAVFEVNGRGVGAGISENGAIDPVTGWPAVNATLWQNGRVSNLGTLPGGYESFAIAINNRGQVAGFASNGIPDPFSMFGWGTQARVFLWQDGHMQDLGTLGGTNGGSNWMNNRGEVVGQSNLAGDQTFHPFLWDGHALQDLGTLGGNFGSANWVNEAGDAVGWASPPGDQTAHAVLWRNGARRDLGVPPGDTFSFANAINAAGQVVGNAGACANGGCAVHGFIWQDGAIADLNTLVAPSDEHVTETAYINDRGEIAGEAVLPNGDQHAVLLVPAPLAAREGLTSNAPAPGTVSTVAPAAPPRASATVCETALRWRVRLARGYHLPCFEE